MASVNVNAVSYVQGAVPIYAAVSSNEYLCESPILQLSTAANPGSRYKVRGYYAAAHEVFVTQGTPVTPAPTGHATVEVGHLKIG